MCSNQELIHQFGRTELWSPSTNTLAKASEVLANRLVLLYFSAHWCRPCQRFTPVLIELYKKLKAENNKKEDDFEVVYCSMDRTNAEYQAYTKNMPWWCIERGNPVIESLGRTYGAQGIPHLVILDASGDILVADGVGEVSMDPSGIKFPWRPKPITELLPKTLMKSPTLCLSTSSLDEKYLMLYFSAHWCKPCQVFTKKLNCAYMKLKAMREDFELLFLSKDDTFEDFIDYYKTMSFCALPYSEKEAMTGLFKLYRVNALPTLIMLSPVQRQSDGSMTRAVINKDLVSIIQHTDYISDFPYHPKPYGDLTTTTHDINTTRCLVVFCEGCDDDEQEDIVEAIKMAAENYRAECTATAVFFFWAIESKGLASNVRHALRLVPIEEPTMVLLDIPDNGGYYKSQETDIGLESILDFIRSPGQRLQIS